MSRNRRKKATPLFIGPRQFAGLVNLCRPTIYKLIQAGEIKAVRVGGAWRIAASEVTRLLEQTSHV